jgi:hypothetical protein
VPVVELRRRRAKIGNEECGETASDDHCDGAQQQQHLLQVHAAVVVELAGAAASLLLPFCIFVFEI